MLRQDPVPTLDDPCWRRLLRRCATVPAIALALLLLSALSPLLVPALGLVDALRRPRVALRLLCVLWIYLAAETIGVLCLLLVWLRSRLIADAAERRRRLQGSTARVQRAWASVMLAAFLRLFHLRLQIDIDGGPAALLAGPAVVMIRHCSLFDTLLATPLLSQRHGIRLRFVLKRELLIDPCLDIAGHILPNVFIRRDSGRAGAEIARIRDLAGGIDATEWGLIYPEGTRATPGKRQRALQRLQASDPDLYARAAAMTQVLPPQLGGPLAMLEGAPQADLVLFAHHGLEGVQRMSDLWKGRLLHRTISVRLWRVPRAAIPPIGPAAGRAQVEWLFARWQEVDAWIAARAAQEAA